MTPAALALTALLSAVDGEAAARAALGLRGAAGDVETEPQAELALTPSLRASVATPTADATLSYAPQLTLRTSGAEPDPALLHVARLGGAWRARPALRLQVDGGASVGTSDLVRVDAQEAGGELRTVATDATVQRIDARLELAAEVRLGERSRARVRAWAFDRGGLGARSRALLPEERGGAGALRLGWDAGIRDAHELEAVGSITELAGGRQVALGTAGERWRHRATRTLELHAELGASAHAARGAGAWDAAELLPIAAAGFGQELTGGAVRLGLALDVELRPTVDAVTASVDERAGLRAALTATGRDGWSGRADVAVAVLMRPGTDGVAARVGLQGAKAVDRSWALTAGVWLSQQRDPRPELPSFLQWGAFVGGTGVARGRS